MIELGGCCHRENNFEGAMALYGRAFRLDNNHFANIIKTMTTIPHGRFSADYRRMRRNLETAGL